MMFLQNQISTISKPAGTQAFLTATPQRTHTAVLTDGYHDRTTVLTCSGILVTGAALAH